MSNRPRGNCVSVCVCVHVCAISKGSFPILYWSNKQSLVENMKQKQESRTPPTVCVVADLLFIYFLVGEKKKLQTWKQPRRTG